MTLRVQIIAPRRSTCRICLDYVDAASEFEWHCPILSETICETHCEEAQLGEYKETRDKMARAVSHFGDSDDLLATCVNCPFGSTARLESAKDSES